MSGTDGKPGAEPRSPALPPSAENKTRDLGTKLQRLAEDWARKQGSDPYALLADAVRQIMHRD